MKSVVVVGSGPSGVHFALTLLHKGYHVTMLDVGRSKPSSVNPNDSFNTLKESLADPVHYFLGSRFEAVLFPDHDKEYYGFPPSKQYVFADAHENPASSSGIEPLFSFARGGLAEAWTGGSYPFDDDDLKCFRISYRELEPYYIETARRIGVTGAADDMARSFPVHLGLEEPLRLDEHSESILAAYDRKKGYLNNSLGCYIGRSRLATLSRDREGRGACKYLGRCLWGCPVEALYTPSVTLQECLTHPNFDYRPGSYVSHFEFNAHGRVTAVMGRSVHTGEAFRLDADRLALAAGTLMSSRIFLESIRLATGKCVRLAGLMDNRQIMVPFVNLRLIGKRYDPDTYQYHQLAMGFEGSGPGDYIHCQLTTLKTAMIHPIVQNVPFDLRTALFLFRHLHAALGLVNINLADSRRPSNYVGLEVDSRGATPKLKVHYEPSAAEGRRLRNATALVRKALWALGCVVPPGMTRVRPMGASVHYAGTIPMSDRPDPLTSTRQCRSNDFENLFFVDGTTFPFLPAKNLTFTLMANAIRVADQAF